MAMGSRATSACFVSGGMRTQVPGTAGNASPATVTMHTAEDFL